MKFRIECMSDERSGEGPPPPSPLTGAYLLVVLPQLHSPSHKDRLIQALTKGLITWDAEDCHVDLDKELQNITAQSPEGEEAKNGERLIQFASENLVTEVLIHPQLNTLVQCMRNCLSSFTRHRHIVHAGYTSTGNGAWILQDGTFSFSDFSDMYSEHEVQRVLRAYEGTVSVDVHCSSEGDWWALRAKDPFSKVSRVRLNPSDKSTASQAVRDFLTYLGKYLVPAGLNEILESSEVVGNIRFSHPTLYVFPGGQGDAALFGINGFNMLVDGGFSRKSCFWDFTRHLDRLDSVLMTRINNGNLQGLASLIRRKKSEQVYPQVGHFFSNIPDRKQVLSPDGDKDRDPLLINLIEEGQEMLSGLRHLGLKHQSCYRESNVEPINLYHKVGHGKLDMYVLSPAKDSREVREFLAKWTAVDSKIFCSYSRKGEFNFPLSSKTSICALLVWQPANPEDNITRILFPGSTPQQKIFEGLDRLKNLEFMKHPICTAKSVSPSSSTAKLSLKGAPQPPIKSTLIEKVAESEKKPIEPVKAVKQIADVKKTSLPPKTKLKIDRPKEKPKTDVDAKQETAKIEKKPSEAVDKKPTDSSDKKPSEAVNKVETKKEKPKRIVQKPAEKKVSKSSEKKTESVKSSPTTPKKTVDSNVSETPKPEVKNRASRTKASPSATPAKSAKEANNRKVVELKSRETSKLHSQKPPPSKKEEPKKSDRPVKKATVSPKGYKSLSPVKAAKPKPKLDVKKVGKSEKEIGTDSSAVSTPSTADAELIKAKEDAKSKEVDKAEDSEGGRKESEDRGKSISKEEDEDVLIIEKVERSNEVTGTSDVETIELHLQKASDEKKRAPDSIDVEFKSNSLEKEGPEIPEPQQVAQEEVRDIIETATEIVVSKKLDLHKTDSQEISTKDQISVDKIITPKEKELKSADVDQKIDESQPDEKFSTTVESGATTTAPTLPEDERIPLDEIKEGVEEKYAKEETKEKDVAVVPRPEQPPTSLPQVPVIAGTAFDQRAQALKDIVKTPDEVADLPVHEEVDVGYYESDRKEELLPVPATKRDKKDETNEEMKLFKDNLEKEDKSKDLKEDLVESTDIYSHTTTDLDLVSSSPKSGKPLESDEKEEGQVQQEKLGITDEVPEKKPFEIPESSIDIPGERKLSDEEIKQTDAKIEQKTGPKGEEELRSSSRVGPEHFERDPQDGIAGSESDLDKFSKGITEEREKVEQIYPESTTLEVGDSTKFDDKSKKEQMREDMSSESLIKKESSSKETEPLNGAEKEEITKKTGSGTISPEQKSEILVKSGELKNIEERLVKEHLEDVNTIQTQSAIPESSGEPQTNEVFDNLKVEETLKSVKLSEEAQNSADDLSFVEKQDLEEGELKEAKYINGFVKEELEDQEFETEDKNIYIALRESESSPKDSDDNINNRGISSEDSVEQAQKNIQKDEDIIIEQGKSITDTTPITHIKSEKEEVLKPKFEETVDDIKLTNSKIIHEKAKEIKEDETPTFVAEKIETQVESPNVVCEKPSTNLASEPLDHEAQTLLEPHVKEASAEKEDPKSFESGQEKLIGQESKLADEEKDNFPKVMDTKKEKLVDDSGEKDSGIFLERDSENKETVQPLDDEKSDLQVENKMKTSDESNDIQQKSIENLEKPDKISDFEKEMREVERKFETLDKQADLRASKDELPLIKELDKIVPKDVVGDKKVSKPDEEADDEEQIEPGRILELESSAEKDVKGLEDSTKMEISQVLITSEKEVKLSIQTSEMEKKEEKQPDPSFKISDLKLDDVQTQVKTGEAHMKELTEDKMIKEVSAIISDEKEKVVSIEEKVTELDLKIIKGKEINEFNILDDVEIEDHHQEREICSELKEEFDEKLPVAEPDKKDESEKEIKETISESKIAEPQIETKLITDKIGDTKEIKHDTPEKPPGPIKIEVLDIKSSKIETEESEKKDTSDAISSKDSQVTSKEKADIKGISDSRLESPQSVMGDRISTQFEKKDDDVLTENIDDKKNEISGENVIEARGTKPELISEQKKFGEKPQIKDTEEISKSLNEGAMNATLESEQKVVNDSKPAESSAPTSSLISDIIDNEESFLSEKWDKESANADLKSKMIDDSQDSVVQAKEDKNIEKRVLEIKDEVKELSSCIEKTLSDVKDEMKEITSSIEKGIFSVKEEEKESIGVIQEDLTGDTAKASSEVESVEEVNEKISLVVKEDAKDTFSTVDKRLEDLTATDEKISDSKEECSDQDLIIKDTKVSSEEAEIKDVVADQTFEINKEVSSRTDDKAFLVKDISSDSDKRLTETKDKLTDKASETKGDEIDQVLEVNEVKGASSDLRDQIKVIEENIKESKEETPVTAFALDDKASSGPEGKAPEVTDESADKVSKIKEDQITSSSLDGKAEFISSGFVEEIEKSTESKAFETKEETTLSYTLLDEKEKQISGIEEKVDRSKDEIFDEKAKLISPGIDEMVPESIVGDHAQQASKVEVGASETSFSLHEKAKIIPGIDEKVQESKLGFMDQTPKIEEEGKETSAILDEKEINISGAEEKVLQSKIDSTDQAPEIKEVAPEISSSSNKIEISDTEENIRESNVELKDQTSKINDEAQEVFSNLDEKGILISGKEEKVSEPKVDIIDQASEIKVVTSETSSDEKVKVTLDLEEKVSGKEDIIKSASEIKKEASEIFSALDEKENDISSKEEKVSESKVDLSEQTSTIKDVDTEISLTTNEKVKVTPGLEEMVSNKEDIIDRASEIKGEAKERTSTIDEKVKMISGIKALESKVGVTDEASEIKIETTELSSTLDKEVIVVSEVEGKELESKVDFTDQTSEIKVEAPETSSSLDENVKMASSSQEKVPESKEDLKDKALKVKEEPTETSCTLDEKLKVISYDEKVPESKVDITDQTSEIKVSSETSLTLDKKADLFSATEEMDAKLKEDVISKTSKINGETSETSSTLDKKVEVDSSTEEKVPQFKQDSTGQSSEIKREATETSFISDEKLKVIPSKEEKVSDSKEAIIGKVSEIKEGALETSSTLEKKVEVVSSKDEKVSESKVDLTEKASKFKEVTSDTSLTIDEKVKVTPDLIEKVSVKEEIIDRTSEINGEAKETSSTIDEKVKLISGMKDLESKVSVTGEASEIKIETTELSSTLDEVVKVVLGVEGKELESKVDFTNQASEIKIEAPETSSTFDENVKMASSMEEKVPESKVDLKDQASEIKEESKEISCTLVEEVKVISLSDEKVPESKVVFTDHSSQIKEESSESSSTLDKKVEVFSCTEEKVSESKEDIIDEIKGEASEISLTLDKQVEMLSSTEEMVPESKQDSIRQASEIKIEATETSSTLDEKLKVIPSKVEKVSESKEDIIGRVSEIKEGASETSSTLEKKVEVVSATEEKVPESKESIIGKTLEIEEEVSETSSTLDKEVKMIPGTEEKVFESKEGIIGQHSEVMGVASEISPALDKKVEVVSGTEEKVTESKEDLIGRPSEVKGVAAEISSAVDKKVEVVSSIEEKVPERKEDSIGQVSDNKGDIPGLSLEIKKDLFTTSTSGDEVPNITSGITNMPSESKELLTGEASEVKDIRKVSYSVLDDKFKDSEIKEKSTASKEELKHQSSKIEDEVKVKSSFLDDKFQVIASVAESTLADLKKEIDPAIKDKAILKDISMISDSIVTDPILSYTVTKELSGCKEDELKIKDEENEHIKTVDAPGKSLFSTEKQVPDSKEMEKAQSDSKGEIADSSLRQIDVKKSDLSFENEKTRDIPSVVEIVSLKTELHEASSSIKETTDLKDDRSKITNGAECVRHFLTGDMMSSIHIDSKDLLPTEVSSGSSTETVVTEEIVSHSQITPQQKPDTIAEISEIRSSFDISGADKISSIESKEQKEREIIDSVCIVEKITTEKQDLEGHEDISVVKSTLKLSSPLNGSMVQGKTVGHSSDLSGMSDTSKAEEQNIKSAISFHSEEKTVSIPDSKETSASKSLNDSMSPKLSERKQDESQYSALTDLSMIKDMTSSFISTEKWTGRAQETPEGRLSPSSEASAVWRESDDDLPASPLSTTSHANSPPPVMFSSVYGQRFEDDDSDLEYETALREHAEMLSYSSKEPVRFPTADTKGPPIDMPLTPRPPHPSQPFETRQIPFSGSPFDQKLPSSSQESKNKFSDQPLDPLKPPLGLGAKPTAETEKPQTSRDPIEKWGKPLGLPPPPGEKDYWSPFKAWGRPLHLPSPAPPPPENDTEDTSGSAKTTPKKVAKMNEENNRYASNNIIGKEANNKNKRSDSPVKKNVRDGKKTGMNHIYVDLSYVPHHGNSHYANVEFFKKVRARYYVFSGTEPSKDVFNALLEAKQTWEDKDLEVTIIPTYDTDTLGYWIAENEETLSKYKIDLSPSASRCTINLQDHDTSCSAYRLEF